MQRSMVVGFGNNPPGNTAGILKFFKQSMEQSDVIIEQLQDCRVGAKMGTTVLSPTNTFYMVHWLEVTVSTFCCCVVIGNIL